jgi:hypothetical protein
MAELVVGIAVILAIALVVVSAHFRHEHHRARAARWLDTHPMRDWMRNRR